ncbi:hypothetical protein TNCT_127011 [Trichonephila clavata]|uniref:Uncharacterized protein n=1 Tax=Trichonephila clavata TaxID=2740835 RepID=A0A8X6FLW7_TRICU|nr:hypothetical protein TNCT_127011 [Trichonephila clavata]
MRSSIVGAFQLGSGNVDTPPSSFQLQLYQQRHQMLRRHLGYWRWFGMHWWRKSLSECALSVDVIMVLGRLGAA